MINDTVTGNMLRLLPLLFSLALFTYLLYVRRNPSFRKKTLNKIKDERSRDLYRKFFSKTFFIAVSIITISAIIDALFDWYRMSHESTGIVGVQLLFNIVTSVVALYLIIKLFRSKT